MRIGVLGTGMVGRTIATKVARRDHEVMMGSRRAGNESATDWVASVGEGASQGTFQDAAAHGELLFDCAAGEASLEAIGSARREGLAGKVLVDVSNPLDHGQRMPPGLFVASSDSLGEQIQRAFPEARVVKALNTVNHEVLVDPAKVPGEHDLFVCGDDEEAKTTVVGVLESFGWPRERILDLGGIPQHAGWRATSSSRSGFGERCRRGTSTCTS